MSLPAFHLFLRADNPCTMDDDMATEPIEAATPTVTIPSGPKEVPAPQRPRDAPAASSATTSARSSAEGPPAMPVAKRLRSVHQSESIMFSSSDWLGASRGPAQMDAQMLAAASGASNLAPAPLAQPGEPSVAQTQKPHKQKETRPAAEDRIALQLAIAESAREGADTSAIDDGHAFAKTPPPMQFSSEEEMFEREKEKKEDDDDKVFWRDLIDGLDEFEDEDLTNNLRDVTPKARPRPPPPPGPEEMVFDTHPGRKCRPKPSAVRRQRKNDRPAAKLWLEKNRRGL